MKSASEHPPTLEANPVKVPEPKWSYKIGFLVGGAVFAIASYVLGTALYEMELSLAQDGILVWGRVEHALVDIPQRHLLTFIPWVLGTTAVAIAVGYLFDKQMQYRKAAETLAATDSLTMLATRRVLMTGIARELARAERGLPNRFSVLMVDVDDFKRYNDSHGHLVGDNVLRTVSAIVRESLRTSDLPGRFGGEEIMVLLPGADGEQAATAAERLRTQIQAGTEVSVSIGVAVYPTDGRNVNELIKAADAAMYRAKRSGKNQVCLAGREGVAAHKEPVGRP